MFLLGESPRLSIFRDDRKAMLSVVRGNILHWPGLTKWGAMESTALKDKDLDLEFQES